MPKARAWRKEGKPAKRTHGAATLSEGAMPTRERLEKADGGFEIGGKGEHRVVRMLDAPLEQMRARGQLTEAQYEPLRRLRMHWFLGHQAGSLRAVDLDRVSVCNRDYGGTSEQAIWHRKMFDVAFGAMKMLEYAVVGGVVLGECSITVIGAGLGYRSPYRGRQAVLEHLQSAADKITSAWLTMERA